MCALQGRALLPGRARRTTGGAGTTADVRAVPAFPIRRLLFWRGAGATRRCSLQFDAGLAAVSPSVSTRKHAVALHQTP